MRKITKKPSKGPFRVARTVIILAVVLISCIVITQAIMFIDPVTRKSFEDLTQEEISKTASELATAIKTKQKDKIFEILRDKSDQEMIQLKQTYKNMEDIKLEYALGIALSGDYLEYALELVATKITSKDLKIRTSEGVRVIRPGNIIKFYYSSPHPIIAPGGYGVSFKFTGDEIIKIKGLREFPSSPEELWAAAYHNYFPVLINWPRRPIGTKIKNIGWGEVYYKDINTNKIEQYPTEIMQKAKQLFDAIIDGDTDKASTIIDSIPQSEIDDFVKYYEMIAKMPLARHLKEELNKGDLVKVHSLLSSAGVGDGLLQAQSLNEELKKRSPRKDVIFEILKGTKEDMEKIKLQYIYLTGEELEGPLKEKLTPGDFAKAKTMAYIEDRQKPDKKPWTGKLHFFRDNKITLVGETIDHFGNTDGYVFEFQKQQFHFHYDFDVESFVATSRDGVSYELWYGKDRFKYKIESLETLKAPWSHSSGIIGIGEKLPIMDKSAFASYDEETFEEVNLDSGLFVYNLEEDYTYPDLNTELGQSYEQKGVLTIVVITNKQPPEKKLNALLKNMKKKVIKENKEKEPILIIYASSDQKLYFKTDAEYIDVNLITSIRKEAIAKIEDGTAAPSFSTFVDVFLNNLA